MTLFKTPTAQDVWIEHHCLRCYRMAGGFSPDDDIPCPILDKALTSGRKPPEWDRNQRAQLMQDAYRCNEFRTTPPRTKPKQYEDVPMFDVGAPVDHIHYVPVEGWPDDPKSNACQSFDMPRDVSKPGHVAKDTDHA
jgi:hypothetical protein